MAKQPYTPPLAELLTARIERGYRLSGAGMTEAIQDGGYYDIGDPNPYYPDGQPMTEGITNGETRFF